jgi:hypothetical protein
MINAEKDYDQEIRKILRNRKLSLLAFVMLLPFYLVCGHISRMLEMPDIFLAIVIIPYGLALACLGVLSFFSTCPRCKEYVGYKGVFRISNPYTDECLHCGLKLSVSKTN